MKKHIVYVACLSLFKPMSLLASTVPSVDLQALEESVAASSAPALRLDLSAVVQQQRQQQLASLTMTSSVEEVPFFFPPQRPTSAAEALERQGQILSLQRSYLAMVEDLLALAEEHRQALLTIKLHRRALRHPDRATLATLKEIYDVSNGGTLSEEIGNVERQITHIRTLAQQGIKSATKEFTQFESFLTNRVVPDAEWILFFQYLVSVRIRTQLHILDIDKKRTETKQTLASTRPQDWEKLTPGQRSAVLQTVRNCNFQEQQIRLAYHFLRDENLASLMPFLKIPSLYLYLQGFQRVPGMPNAFEKLCDSDGRPFFMEHPLDPHTKNDLDISYLPKLDLPSLMRGFPPLPSEEVSSVPSSSSKESASASADSSPANRKKKKKKPKKKPVSAMETPEAADEFSATQLPRSALAEPASEGKSSEGSSLISPAAKLLKPDALSAVPPAADPSGGLALAVPLAPSPFSAAAEFPSRPKSYVPAEPAGAQRAARIAALKASNQQSTSANSYRMSPQHPIRLKGEAADLYKAFYKLDKRSSVPFTFSNLLTLMAGFKGSADETAEERAKRRVGVGNGSPYNLIFPVVVERISPHGTERQLIVSRRVIHEPHPDEVIRNAGKRLLELYFAEWGLDPYRGFVTWK